MHEPDAAALLPLHVAAAWLQWTFALDHAEAARLVQRGIHGSAVRLLDREGRPVAGRWRLNTALTVEAEDRDSLVWVPLPDACAAWGEVRAAAAARWRLRLAAPPDVGAVPAAAWCPPREAMDRIGSRLPPAFRGAGDRRLRALAALALSLRLVPAAVRHDRGDPVALVRLGDDETVAGAWPRDLANGTAGSDLLEGRLTVARWSLGRDGGPRPRAVRVVDDILLPALLLADALAQLLTDAGRLPEGLAPEGVPAAAEAAPAPAPGGRGLLAAAAPRSASADEVAAMLELVQHEARVATGRNLANKAAADEVARRLGVRITSRTFDAARALLRERCSAAANPPGRPVGK